MLLDPSVIRMFMSRVSPFSAIFGLKLFTHVSSTLIFLITCEAWVWSAANIGLFSCIPDCASRCFETYYLEQNEFLCYFFGTLAYSNLRNEVHQWIIDSNGASLCYNCSKEVLCVTNPFFTPYQKKQGPSEIFPQLSMGWDSSPTIVKYKCMV